MRICKWEESPRTNKNMEKAAEPKPLHRDPRWRSMTDKEILDFKRNICSNCEYLGRTEGASTYIGNTLCMYADIVKHCRHCSPLDCVEKGYFKQRVTKGRRRSVCLLH